MRIAAESSAPGLLNAAEVPLSEKKMIAEHSYFDTSRQLNRRASAAFHCKLREPVCSSPIHDDVCRRGESRPERSKGISIIPRQCRPCNADEAICLRPDIHRTDGVGDS